MQVKPITTEEFAEAMEAFAPWEDKPLFAVAVSGGADSIALCRLVADYAEQVGGKVVALTVDHGLRPESAAEALQVGKWLKDLNVAHHILVWEGEKPVSRIEEIARDARYNLLLSWCRDNGCLHLLLAHNQGDQAETFLLRLAKSSGVDGLAAMPAQSFRREVEVLRPLLSFSRERIIATNHAYGQEWVEDPSNQSEVFQRVKWRKFMPALKPLGITADSVALAVAKQAEVKDVLANMIADFAASSVKISPLGYAEIAWQAALDLQEETACRLLSHILMTIGGEKYPPRREKVLHLWESLREGKQKSGHTLAGCKVILREKDTQLLIVREVEKLPPPMPLSIMEGKDLYWDRFKLSFAGDIPENAVLAPLGRGKKELFPEVPAAALVSLPAIFVKDTLLLVPHLGYKDKTVKTGNAQVCFMPALPLTGAGHKNKGK